MHVCMSKRNMRVCMFRFAWGLTRLARRARGGLFALRVTRRGRLDTGGLDDRMIRCLMKINGKLLKIDGIDGKSTEIDSSKWNIDEI